ncbi:hypothetical protein CU044_2184 [Streptomyces sp. L-9-10]|nr:hypothetical protein CU044_2184 [Streptomyces sp. L-9-10]
MGHGIGHGHRITRPTAGRASPVDNGCDVNNSAPLPGHCRRPSGPPPTGVRATAGPLPGHRQPPSGPRPMPPPGPYSYPPEVSARSSRHRARGRCP